MVKLKPGYQELRKTPAWATYVKRRWPDGRVLNVEGEMWLYRTVPMGPVEDARSPELSAIVGETLRAAFDELATMAGPIKLTRRQTSKSAYRDVHALLINVPRLFTPDPDAPLAGYHLQQFPHTVVDRRILLIGVRLVPKIDADSLTDTITNVIETLVAGGDPVENFTKDFREADAALARAGLRVPTEEDMRIAESWWNQGDQANVPTLVHPDHLHIFTTVDTARAAAVLAQDPDLKCHNWPPMPDGHTISFATVREFELPYVEGIDHRAHWASKLIQAGAVTISLRGKVEPAPVTRDELRRMRRNYQADIQERYSSGKMDRAEQEDTLAALGDVEAFYAAGGTPTLIETSTIVAFTGRDTRAGYDPTEIGRACGVRLSPMVNVQDRALAETMIASGIRANPYLRDLPSQTIAYSGLPSLSNVGDNDGALLGFTERDRQPAYLAPMAATDADSIPLALVVGQSGAGKMATLSTTLPTPVSDRFPDGRTTMGELRVGDHVFGREGRPCTVTGMSEVEERPELFRVTLSDGQQVLADGNHQWVVSRLWERNGIRHPHRVTAVENWESAQRVIDRLVDLAGELDEDVWLGLDELHALVEEGVAGVFASPQAVYGAMRMTDCEPRLVSRAVTRHRRVSEVVKTDPVVLLPAAEALRAWIGMWEGLSGGNAARWGARAMVRAAAARALLDEVSSGGVLVELTVPQLMRRLRAIDPQVGALDAGFLRKTAVAAGVGSRRGFAEVRVPLPDSHASSVQALEYPARQAVFALALRLSQQAGEQPSLEPGEQVLSTNEILGAGLRTSKGQAVFAIRLPKPIEGPETELPVAPYTFGAWLGDGTSNSGTITSMDDEIIDLVEADGYPLRGMWQNHAYDQADNPTQHYGFEGLLEALRAVLERDPDASYGKLDKRIPAVYLRASRAQRLALLQGLMDTDGTISSRSGGCEISLSKADLAADVLELVRSLGIKASMTVGAAGYRDTSGDQVVCRPRHRITFTTTLEVFRLARKRALLPTQVRRTQDWLYITSIEPVLPGDPDYEPARCISVDSPDHTYLLAGFVPTHNSVLMSWLGDQFARIPNARGERTPVVIFDPKLDSDFSGVVRLSGGVTYSLDELSTADGVFDPLRFSHVPAVGIEGAHATLMAVNPWGTVEERARWETPLLKALNYGVAQGARSTMRALVVAERDGVAARALVDPVRDVMEASPMFSALCGSDDSGQALRAAEGITYIKVGKNSLNLPAPGTAVEDLSIPQKVTLQLVRNIVYGVMSALNGRQGVIMLDEAWVFTSAGRTEMERVGRLARSQQVFPMLFTQRVTDALNADLAGYISRGVILPITDVNEATAACTLFNLEPTPERMARITARQSMGDAGDDSGAPNWRSMRALRDPVTRQVLRGTIGIYADISGRAVPTEIRIPPGFLAAASTNRLDMQDRAREAARAAEADQTPVQQETAFAAPEPTPEAEPVQRLRGMESGW